ncbi:MAG: hypothetical protein COA79_09205 [Planctomycetota bacterium]|nr:MAG: hypothetical protein COA79_09205 [Planctomycetota bacterium]
MRWGPFLTFSVQKEAGFRFNLIDLGLICFLSITSWLLLPVLKEGYLFLIPLYIGYSFFLFCNVFRIGNKLEPFWYIPFSIALYLLIQKPNLFWWIILPIFESLKFILITIKIKSGSYHGIFMNK